MCACSNMAIMMRPSYYSSQFKRYKNLLCVPIWSLGQPNTSLIIPCITDDINSVTV